MSTNPNNIVRVRARNGGRASVYEANGWAQAFSQGLFEGNGVIQNTSADMNVLVGGISTKPDVVIAQNPAGYKIALDIVGQQAIAITTPASNSRISSIVAYTDDLSLSTTEDNVTGSPASCGLIVVNGDTSSSPVAPDDTAIRSAITADGATGSQACYAVIANILVASSTTTITNTLIDNQKATINGSQIALGSIASDKLDLTTFPELQDGVYKDPITGLMIVAKTFTGVVTSNVDLFGMKVGILPAFPFGETFAEPPTTSVTVRPTTATSFWQAGYGPGNITNTDIAANSFCVVRNNERDLPYQANVIAVGRYK